jgi:hypothetical protein
VWSKETPRVARLKGFVNGLKIRVNEIDIGLSIDPEKGIPRAY